MSWRPNPKGIVTSSPGLRGPSYPGTTMFMHANPNGVVALQPACALGEAYGVRRLVAKAATIHTHSKDPIQRFQISNFKFQIYQPRRVTCHRRALLIRRRQV